MDQLSSRINATSSTNILIENVTYTTRTFHMKLHKETQTLPQTACNATIPRNVERHPFRENPVSAEIDGPRPEKLRQMVQYHQKRFHFPRKRAQNL